MRNRAKTMSRRSLISKITQVRGQIFAKWYSQEIAKNFAKRMTSAKILLKLNGGNHFEMI